MTTPNFKPVFGPNGAVMNAPSVTPEMREKLERAARPPTGAELRREFLAFAPYLLIGVIVIASSPSIYALLKSSPWWAGAFAGAAATIAVVLTWRAVVRNFTRWELLSSQKSTRRLQMPEWARWLLTAADSLAVVTYAVFAVGMVSDVDRQHALVWFGLMLPVTLFAAASAALRWYAGQRKWV